MYLDGVLAENLRAIVNGLLPVTIIQSPKWTIELLETPMQSLPDSLQRPCSLYSSRWSMTSNPEQNVSPVEKKQMPPPLLAVADHKGSAGLRHLWFHHGTNE